MDNINQKIAALSPAKRALLELKLKNKTTEVKTQQTIPKRTNESTALLSFAQQRLWFLEQLEPNSPLYHIAEVLRLQGDLNVDVLQQSLDAIVAHHEVLRTNFIAQDGDPIQVIGEPKSVELKVIDLKDCPLSERSTQVQHLLQNESQRPFDLTSDFMLRACLLQLEPQEHILVLVMHHIASDAWSRSILFEQLRTLYQAFKEGLPNPLPKLPIQYADYAVWQRQWLSGEVLENQLKYWKQQLAGATPVLELPTDRQRPPVQTYRGAKHFVVLPQSLSQALSTLSRQEGVTLFMTFLAAFQILLYRYSGQEDILVGSPIAGRNHPEIERLIGFFVNTLVLRTDMSGNPSFRELLQRVRAMAMSAYVNQDLPFEKLVEELQPERSLSYNPLFQVMFAFQNTPQQTFELSGLTITSTYVDRLTSKFDLTLFIVETEQGVEEIWEYNTDLFDASTISQMSGHFQTLLEGIVANPQQHISKLPLLTAAQQHELLFEWNNTQKDYPHKCIHELFEQQVNLTPDAVAVVFENQQLTYQELNNRANQLAHYLRDLGVGPDVPVGICVQRSLEMVVGVLGILKAGGAYVPLDPAYPQDRLSFMLSDSQVAVLLTCENLMRVLPKHEGHVVCLDTDWQAIAQASEENLVNGVEPENLAYVIYTSGSTGMPKGVAMKQLPLSNLISWQLENSTVSTGARTVQFSPISFDVSFQEIFSTWCSGGTLILITDDLRRDATALLDFLNHKAINRLFLPFVALQQLAEVAVGSESLPIHLQEIITAGEQLQITPALTNLFSKLPGCTLHNHYGPSESHVVTAFTLADSVQSWAALPPIGRPIANTSIYILDSNLQPVPIGVPGELYIGGVALARGYLNRPELTAEKFIRDPFSQKDKAYMYKTGDLARYLKHGNIEYFGRCDNQVKIRGFRIELGELEAVLSQHPAVHQAVVIVRQDIPGDKRLVAYVVPDQDSVPTTGELRNFLKEKLPEYMVPSAFVLLDVLPLTPSGKVNRRSLPAPDITKLEPEASYVAPRNDTEHQLTEIWAEILGIQPVGVRDNFFDLGGHSLLAVKLFAQIEKKFAKKLPLATLFQSGTVEALAQLLSPKEKTVDNQLLTGAHEHTSEASWSCLVPIQTKGSKPPLFCIHPLGGETLCYRNLSLHLGQAQPLYGVQPQGLDGKLSLLTRIEEMAALYIKEIQTIQPNGPYFLGGYSMGGIIAYEIAHQLNRQGQKVALLAMFDSGIPGAATRLPLISRIFMHINNLLQRGPSYLRKKLIGWIEWSTYHLRAKYTHFLGIKEPLPQDDTHWDIIDANVLAWNEYTYQPYSGQITLLRVDENSDDSQDDAVGVKSEPLLGWDKLVTGGIDVHYIPGSHYTLFEEPNVRVLAEKLRECLEKTVAVSHT
ncbi:non-ribosomal peptide synthetase [Brasilonema bromeliae SPC951]|uniref:Non-ribosomal peptide synthetase n=1 Tax=Brasilonema bromeliae SPC951 TaxID=385972 RepID=A0ABX1P5Y1_9CYAN|nr:non-ribosomal peptide synthetase [Brasilonema bromeliae]NMG19780.1 non-ribosomal peptide synthetase [Brasilonema bromeliae SPC951]